MGHAHTVTPVYCTPRVHPSPFSCCGMGMPVVHVAPPGPGGFSATVMSYAHMPLGQMPRVGSQILYWPGGHELDTRMASGEVPADVSGPASPQAEVAATADNVPTARATRAARRRGESIDSPRSCGFYQGVPARARSSHRNVQTSAITARPL